MNPGDIILINFPFTIPSFSKIRPAIIITETKDKYRDLIVCAISSVVPSKPSPREIVISRDVPHFSKTGLRVDSVIKIDRIATLRKTDVITTLGECPSDIWSKVVEEFRQLIKEQI